MGEIARIGAGEIFKERVNGCQTVIPRGHAVVSLLFQVIQEAANPIGRQVFQSQMDAGLAAATGGELQEQLPGVAQKSHELMFQDQVLP